MMKGVAVKLPDEVLAEIDRIAEAEFDGNRNRAVEAVLEKGLAYDEVVRHQEDLQAWIDDWTAAGRLTRMKWALLGRDDQPEPIELP